MKVNPEAIHIFCIIRTLQRRCDIKSYREVVCWQEACLAKKVAADKGSMISAECYSSYAFSCDSVSDGMIIESWIFTKSQPTRAHIGASLLSVPIFDDDTEYSSTKRRSPVPYSFSISSIDWALRTKNICQVDWTMVWLQSKKVK